MKISKKRTADHVASLAELQSAENKKYEEYRELMKCRWQHEAILQKSRDEEGKSVDEFEAFKKDALRGLPLRFKEVCDEAGADEVVDEETSYGVQGEGGPDEEGDSDEDEIEAVVESPYRPTSPAYSPTSPAYLMERRQGRPLTAIERAAWLDNN